MLALPFLVGLFLTKALIKEVKKMSNKIKHDYVNTNTSERSETLAYVFWAGLAIMSTSLLIANMLWVMGAI